MTTCVQVISIVALGATLAGGPMNAAGAPSSAPLTVLVRPVGVWCNGRPRFEVVLRNSSAQSYFLGVPRGSDRSFPYKYEEAFSVGTEPARILGVLVCQCTHGPDCEMCSDPDKTVELRPGEERSWRLELSGVRNLVAGRMVFSTKLYWYGAWKASEALTKIESGRADQQLELRAAAAGCFLAAKTAANKALQRTTRLPRSARSAVRR